MAMPSTRTTAQDQLPASATGAGAHRQYSHRTSRRLPRGPQRARQRAIIPKRCRGGQPRGRLSGYRDLRGQQRARQRTADHPRLIAGRSAAGNNRQIFFVDCGGFDNHRNRQRSPPPARRSRQHVAPSAGMKHLAAQDSNFDLLGPPTGHRTLIAPGHPTAPTSRRLDHAWGGSAVFGGAVNGGNFYGCTPTSVGGWTMSQGSRSRWIHHFRGPVRRRTRQLVWRTGSSSEMETILPICTLKTHLPVQTQFLGIRHRPADRGRPALRRTQATARRAQADPQRRRCRRCRAAHHSAARASTASAKVPLRACSACRWLVDYLPAPQPAELGQHPQ